MSRNALTKFSKNPIKLLTLETALFWCFYNMSVKMAA